MLRPVRPQTGVTAPEGWDREFYDYVMSLRLKGDMKYILVKQDSNGTSVSLNLQALLDSISIPTSGGGKGGDASYKGYFAVVEDSNEEERAVSVVWGASPESNNLCLLNGKHALVPATRVILPTTDSYFILIKWVVATDTVTIVAETTLTEPSTSLVYYPLAQVVSGTINQLHYGIPSLIVTGGC